MQKALTDVQALMNVTQSMLPSTGANMKPSWVVPIDPLNLPVLTLSLHGDAKQGWDLARVREFADNTVINRLKGVPSVYTRSCRSAGIGGRCRWLWIGRNWRPTNFRFWMCETPLTAPM